MERTAEGVVAGVDEAGCAPLAGPVAAAAVVLPEAERRPRRLKGLTDSKLLPAETRERLYDVILDMAQVGVGAASAAEIDRLNIHNATMLAMRRAVIALRLPPDVALVDGNRAPDLACRVERIVKGETRSLSIAAASVVAKVARDRLMARLARNYPGYGWETNMGYGTDEHYLALLHLGPTPHHRRSFAPLSTLFSEDHPDAIRLRINAEPHCDDPASLRLIRLRRDLHAVFAGEGAHVGVVKWAGRRWTFKAVGFDERGRLTAGTGPFAPWHNRPVPRPEVEALRGLLASP